MTILENWQKVLLGDVVEIAGGTTPSRADERNWGGKIPWATPSDVTALSGAQPYLRFTRECITRRALESSSLRILPPGTVLVTSRATIGATAVAEFSLTTNQGFLCFLPSRNVESLFLKYWADSSKEVFRRLASGSTFLELGRTAAREIPILLPPLPEQHRIAEILASVDEAIQATEAVIEQTKCVKQGLLAQLLTRGIGHSRFQKASVGKIPGTWKVRPLGEIAEVQTGIAKGGREIKEPEELPYLRVANVQDGYIDLGEVKTIVVSGRDVKRFLLQKGDVLLTEGGDLDKLGRGAVWGGEVAPCLHQNHIFAVRPDPAVLLPEFLATQTGSAYGKRYFLGAAKQTTNLASINSSQLKAFPTLVPPLNEQGKIVEILASVEGAIEAQTKELQSQLALKRGLLSDLLSGRVRVKVPPA